MRRASVTTRGSAVYTPSTSEQISQYSAPSAAATADTTTTTSGPARRVRMTRSATFFSLATSATEEPPYFWTTIDIPGTRARGQRPAARSQKPEARSHAVLRERRDYGRVVAR